MDNFKKDIELLADSIEEIEESGFDLIAERNSALNFLKNIASEGANSFNNKLDKTLLRVHEIPMDLVPLIINFNGSAEAFTLITRKKYIFFVSNEEDNIFIYSFDSSSFSKGNITTSRPSQLLVLSYVDSDGETKFYDNSNMEIDPYEIIFELIKWGL